jgi:hypothetical protein
MLKEQLNKYGGKAFTTRKKQGLGLPMNNWLKNEMHWEFNLGKHLIHEFVSQQKINNLLKIHIDNKKNATQELWRILLLHKWLTLNF